MNRSVADYLLFLAETLTLALAVVATVAGTAAAVSAVRRRGRRRPRVEVTDLGRRYDDLRFAMRAALLPRQVVRRELKEHRRRLKDRAKALSKTAGSTPDGAGRPRVFVIDFTGDLRASAVTALREEVTAVLSVATRDDEVVVRLENPGGVVHDQGLAASQLQRIRQRRIPLTVAVDKVAASGGYMMACVGDRILAAPFALVGSIGVIAVVPNVHRLLDRYGIGVEQFTGGEFKRTVTPYGDTTDAERAKFTSEIEAVHELFKDFVATNRPQLDLAAVGTGEAWHGVQALELRLVDELTTSDDYLLAARERADVYLVGYRGDRTARGRARRRTAAAALGGLAERAGRPDLARLAPLRRG